MSVTDTERIAGDLARRLAPGACIGLEGELGSGKTQFVRGMVTALGGDPRGVSSPTFVIMNIYDTPTMKVHHLDAYRLHGAGELESLGFDELLTQGGIVVVEWASRVADAMPGGAVSVHVDTTGETSRTITIGSAPRSAAAP